MSPSERDGLVGRIRQIRRQARNPSAPNKPAPEPTRLRALENRLAHLEELVEGLQDAVYREARRQDTEITEIKSQLDPAAMATALSRDARERGL